MQAWQPFSNNNQLKPTFGIWQCSLSFRSYFQLSDQRHYIDHYPHSTPIPLPSNPPIFKFPLHFVDIQALEPPWLTISATSPSITTIFHHGHRFHCTNFTTIFSAPARSARMANASIHVIVIGVARRAPSSGALQQIAIIVLLLRQPFYLFNPLRRRRAFCRRHFAAVRFIQFVIDPFFSIHCSRNILFSPPLSTRNFTTKSLQHLSYKSSYYFFSFVSLPPPWHFVVVN